MIKKILFSVFCLLLACSSAFAQEFGAEVNRNPVPLGEAFMLTLTAENVSAQEQPDLSVLEKDFEVYSTGQSNRIRITNNKKEEVRQWTIGLIAKKAGDFEIPAIALGKISSAPIKIKVTTESTPSGASQDTVSVAPKYTMSGKISPQNPYVQQQMIYHLSIQDSGGLQGIEPQFILQNQDDWIIKRLSEPKILSTYKDGKKIREINIDYALFPQKSGKLKTPAVRFEGFYLANDQSAPNPFDNMFNDGFGLQLSGMFASRVPVVLNVDPIDVNVKSIPQNNPDRWWVPAEDVQIYDEWEPKNPEFKSGEAVSRTVFVKAVGITDNQLPNIDFSEAEGFKQYPEKAQTQMTLNGNKIVSLKKVTNVYIPEKEGEIVLPEIKVHWFDTQNNRFRTVSLPAKKITVKQGNASSLMTQTEKKTTSSDAVPNTVLMPSDAQKTTSALPKSYLLIAFALGFFCGFLFFRNKKVENTSKTVKNIEKDWEKQVLQAAEKNDLKKLRDALVLWAQQKHPDEQIRNLQDIERCYPNPSFKNELQNLMNDLYASCDKKWNKDIFMQSFKEINKASSKTQKGEMLPKLYKD